MRNRFPQSGKKQFCALQHTRPAHSMNHSCKGNHFRALFRSPQRMTMRVIFRRPCNRDLHCSRLAVALKTCEATPTKSQSTTQAMPLQRMTNKTYTCLSPGQDSVSRSHANLLLLSQLGTVKLVQTTRIRHLDTQQDRLQVLLGKCNQLNRISLTNLQNLVQQPPHISCKYPLNHHMNGTRFHSYSSFGFHHYRIRLHRHQEGHKPIHRPYFLQDISMCSLLIKCMATYKLNTWPTVNRMPSSEA